LTPGHVMLHDTALSAWTGLTRSQAASIFVEPSWGVLGFNSGQG
jgi:hypothetical protein